MALRELILGKTESPVKDVKPIFLHAIAQSETMILDRMLVRLLPTLLQHGLMLTADAIRQSEQIPVTDELFAHIRLVADELVGTPYVDL